MRKLVPLLAATALSACNFAPKYVQPAVPVAPAFPEADAGVRAAVDIGWRELVFFEQACFRSYPLLQRVVFAAGRFLFVRIQKL